MYALLIAGLAAAMPLAAAAEPPEDAQTCDPPGIALNAWKLAPGERPAFHWNDPMYGVDVVLPKGVFEEPLPLFLVVEAGKPFDTSVSSFAKGRSTKVKLHLLLKADGSSISYHVEAIRDRKPCGHSEGTLSLRSPASAAGGQGDAATPAPPKKSARKPVPDERPECTMRVMEVPDVDPGSHPGSDGDAGESADPRMVRDSQCAR